MGSWIDGPVARHGWESAPATWHAGCAADVVRQAGWFSNPQHIAAVYRDVYLRPGLEGVKNGPDESDTESKKQTVDTRHFACVQLVTGPVRRGPRSGAVFPGGRQGLGRRCMTHFPAAS